ncbi:hypothetical protein BDN72DRAFT_800715 [Pluteus cervinus]|uniref:Uncharacterized protein n=1 Tax=Pluteus cervinus TaxID=181527 RepID=A0ACD3AK81_9AGAR|nr:hypothetical protein BDN72DRAFT_800715 [Pluteus cervinus]
MSWYRNPFRGEGTGESRPPQHPIRIVSPEPDSPGALSPNLSPTAMSESSLSDASSFRSSPDSGISPTTTDGELVEREDQEDGIEEMPGQFEPVPSQTSAASPSASLRDVSTSNVATQEVVSSPSLSRDTDKRPESSVFTNAPSIPDTNAISEAVTVSIFGAPPPDSPFSSSLRSPLAPEDSRSNVSPVSPNNPFLTLEELRPSSFNTTGGAVTSAVSRLPPFTSVQQRSFPHSSPPFSPTGGSDVNWQGFGLSSPLSSSAVPQPLFPLQPTIPKPLSPWIDTRLARLDSAVSGPSSSSVSLNPPALPPRGTISVIEVPEEFPAQDILTDAHVITERIERIFTGAEVIVSHPGSSQYAQGTGVSACGLASLNCARVIFEKQKEGLLGEVILGDVMRKETIEDIMTICAMWTSQAHLDVEDLHKVPYFENELLLQSTRYGRPSIQEFKTLLSELNTSELQSAVAIITRPPEIIACFKVPTPRGDVFVIFDSHPRPLYSKGAAFIFYNSIDETASRLSKILAVDQSIVNDPDMDWQAQLLGNFSGHIFTAKQSATITSLYDARKVILELGIQVLMKDTKVEEMQGEVQTIRGDKERLEGQVRSLHEQRTVMLNRIDRLADENNQLRTRASSSSGSSNSSWWFSSKGGSKRGRDRNSRDGGDPRNEEEQEEMEKDAIIESLKSENERLQKEMNKGDDQQDVVMKSLQEEMIRLREVIQNAQPMHGAGNVAHANIAAGGGQVGRSRKGKEREVPRLPVQPLVEMAMDLDREPLVPLTMPDVIRMPEPGPVQSADEDHVFRLLSDGPRPVPITLPGEGGSGRPAPVVSIFDTPTQTSARVARTRSNGDTPTSNQTTTSKTTEGSPHTPSGSGRTSGDVLMSSVLGGFYRSTSQSGSGGAQQGQGGSTAIANVGPRAEETVHDVFLPPSPPTPPPPQRQPSSRPPSYNEAEFSQIMSPPRPSTHTDRSNLTGSFMERQRQTTVASRGGGSNARAPPRERQLSLGRLNPEPVGPLPPPPSVLAVPSPPSFSLLPTSESPPRPTSRLAPVGRLSSPNRRGLGGSQRLGQFFAGRKSQNDNVPNNARSQEDEDFRLAAELQNQWNQDDVRTQREIARILSQDDFQGFDASPNDHAPGSSSRTPPRPTAGFGGNSSGFFDRILSATPNSSSSDVSASGIGKQNPASPGSNEKGKQPMRLPAISSFMSRRPAPVPVPVPSSVAAALNADSDDEDLGIGLARSMAEVPPAAVARLRPPVHPSRPRPRNSSAIEDALFDIVSEMQPKPSANTTISDDAVVQSLLEDMRRDQRGRQQAEKLQREEQLRLEQSEKDRQLAETFNTGTFECGVCFDTMTMEDVARVEECEHAFCRECLREYIRSKVKDRRFPIPCPTCVANKDANSVGVIHEHMVQLVGIPEDEYQVYIELQLVQFSILVHCRQCKQSAFIDREEHEAASIIGCPLPNCSFSWCKQCNQQVTFGVKHSCDGSAELDHLMQEQGWKKCPGCQTPVQKSTGCNHMTCITPGCNCHFCYTCGQTIIRGGTRKELDIAIRTHYNSRCELFRVPPEVLG